MSLNNRLFSKNVEKSDTMEIDPQNPVTQRVNKAIDIYHCNRIERIADFGETKIYLVESQTDKNDSHVVLTGSDMKCSCPDHFWRGIICKHSFAVLMLEQNWSLNNKEMEIVA